MFSDECLHPGRSCSGRDSMKEAVVYRKELITAGLDADTQTPAGMRHRIVGSAKLSRGSFNLNRSFIDNSRPFADGNLAIKTELNDGAETIKDSCSKTKTHFFRKIEKFCSLFPIYCLNFQIKLKVLCDVPDNFPMCFCPHVLLGKETD